MKVVFVTQVEEVVVGYRKGKLSMAGTKSKAKQTITDRVEMLSLVINLQNIGTVKSGDVEVLKRLIKGEEPHLTYNVGLCII